MAGISSRAFVQRHPGVETENRPRIGMVGAVVARSVVALAMLLVGCGQSVPAPPAGSITSGAASVAPVSRSDPGGTLVNAEPSAAPASAGAQGAGKLSGGDRKGYPIRIGFASPAVASLPFYAALTYGFFEQQHLAIDMIQMPPNVAITALYKGEIEFTNSPSNAIEGATRGMPLRVVLSSWDRAPWTIVGKAELRSISDLRGGLVGTNQVGSSPYLYLQAGLKRAGLSMTDARIVSSPGTQDTFGQLLAGRIDAAVLSPPFDVQAEEKGFHEIAFIGDALEQPYIGLGTNTAFIRDQRPQVVAAIRALMDANRWLKGGHAEEAAGLVVNYVGAPSQAARSSIDKMLPLLGDTGEMSAQAPQQAIDIQAEITQKPINVTPEQLVDYGPLHDALGRT